MGIQLDSLGNNHNRKKSRPFWPLLNFLYDSKKVVTITKPTWPPLISFVALVFVINKLINFKCYVIVCSTIFITVCFLHLTVHKNKLSFMAKN